VALLAGMCPLYGQPLTNADLVTLHQLKVLTAAQAAHLPSVRLKAVVVCYDAGWHQLYLHDGHETLYFNADDFPAQLTVGQALEITGQARDTNKIEHLQVNLLGQEALPPARSLELSNLAQDHGEWVEINGRVLSAETSRGRLALLLNDQGLNCLVYVLGSPVPEDFKKLLDCRIRVRGINASKVLNGRLDSALFFASGWPEISIIEPANTRASRPPVVSIGSLLNRELGSWTNSWVHVNGLVVSYQPGQSLVVKDPTGLIRAQVIQLTEMLGDERVDVWGFLEASPQESFLKQAYFEVVQPPARSVVAAAPAVLRTHPPELLTSMAEIRKLRREQAALNLPVRLRGVLTYADPQWRNGFIQDRADALYVDLNPTQTDLSSGQWVELSGQTSPGGFAPEVTQASIRVLGTTNLPAAARVELADLANGDLDAHWVEMEGVVRRVDEQAGHASLTLMTPQGRFKAIIPGYDNKPLPTHLLDALVSVQGACTSEPNARWQLSGITLHVPSLAQVKLLEPSPTEPFAMATTWIGDVAKFKPDRLAGQRVKIQGVVTLPLPGEGFILQDPSGGLRVLSRQTNQVQAGDLLDVLGFPAIGGFSPYLEEAWFRRTGSGALPAPKRTTAEEILLQGAHDTEVVEVRARLLQSVPRSANPQLVLQDGPIIFTAHVENQDRRASVPALASGSLLRVTGVCAIQAGERHEPVTFRLLLRQPEDIDVLQTPPWWTARHSFMLAGGMMLAVAATLGWVALLRRQVWNQTKLIRQKLDDEAVLERELLEISNREQRRIGHDLHDGVCQQLAGIAFMTSTLADELQDKGLPESDQADKIATLLNQAIEQTRGVARGLFPVRLEETGLLAALDEMAANARELYKINCRFVAQRPPASLDPGVALHLYYISLEAVANAAKHGAAANVMVSLEPAGEVFLLTIKDDGAGFSPSPRPQSGMGIRIMQYRAQVIGATLDVQSKPGSGTTVRCRFRPLAAGSPGNGAPGPAPARTASAAKSLGSVYGQNAN
jgi:signal transduction histidine kinase